MHWPSKTFLKGWSARALLAGALLASATPVAAGTLSTVADDAGDAAPLRYLYPHPDFGRNLTVSGSSVTAAVPRWLLGDPASLVWFLGTYTLDGSTQYDQIPDAGTITWSDPYESSADDPADAALDPTSDLRRGGIDPSGTNLSFAWEFAGPVATGAGFGFSSYNLDAGARYAGIAPLADGTWYFYVQAGSVPFPWTPGAYADVVAAEVNEGASGRIDLAMTLAGAVPSSFGAGDAAPVLVWFFDADDDPATGGNRGMDVNAQVRYNRNAGAFEAAVRVWNGRQYEDLPDGVDAFAVQGDRVTLSTRLGTLGLSRTFRWYAAVHVDVGPPDDVYQNRVDATVAAGMTLSEDPGTEPGLSGADAWVFPLSFPLEDARFAAALADLLLNSEARATVQSALGCAQTVCSVEEVVSAVSADLAQSPAALLRTAPLAERLGTGPAASAFTATLSSGNDRLGGLVFLDFLAAAPGGAPLFTGDLTLCVQDAGASACTGARTLLTSAELQALDPGKSYVIVPRFTTSLPAETCVACGGASVAIRAATSQVEGGLAASASVALHGAAEPSLQSLLPQQPQSIAPAPQTQARTLTVYLEFPVAGTGDRVRATQTACTVDVLVREAGGTVSARTTVPAHGLQSVDLGLRPPEDWTLVLVSTCAAEVYVSLEDRSYRGIRLCEPGDGHLCLGEGGRFRVEAVWRDFTGGAGSGHALPLTPETGGFWFFGADNVELLVKVLDGTALNGNFWVFYGGLSNVEYEIRVTDTKTGAFRTYVNPAGSLASAGETAAFAAEPGGSGLRTIAVPGRNASEAPAGSCAAGGTRLCLGGRFAVEVSWRDFAGATGAGQAVPWSGDAGFFWFFGPDNLELAVKVLDGTGVNGHHWVFFGALSNVAYTVTVTDTATGAERRYENPAGRFASVADTGAF